MGDEVLGLVEGLPGVGTFLLRDEMGTGLACSTLILSTRKGNYAGHLQWYRRR